MPTILNNKDPPSLALFHRQNLARSLPEHPPDSPHHPDNVLRLSRSPADDAKLSQLLDSIEMLARVANGLSLQEGLLEDAFSADEVVSELLRMGTLSPQQFVSLDFNKLKTAVENLKTLATTTLSKDPVVLGNEKRLIFLQQFVKFYETSGNFDPFSGNTMDINLRAIRILQFETKTTEITNTFNRAKTVKTIIDDLNDTGVTHSIALFRMKGLADSGLKEAAQLFKDFQPTMNIIDQIRQTPLDPSFLELLVNEYNNRISLDDLPAIGAQRFINWELSTANFDAFEAVAKEFNSIDTFLLSFEKLITARMAKQTATSKITAGFPDGPTNVEKLLIDVSSQTLKDVLKKGGQEMQVLDQMLGALRSVGAKSKDVETLWNSAGLKQETTKTVLSDQIRMSANSQVNFSKEMTKLHTCEKNNNPQAPDDITLVKNAYDSIVSINNVLNNLSALDQMERLKKLPYLTDLLKNVHTLTSSETAEITRISEELQKNPEVKAERKLLDDAIAELKQLETLTTAISGHLSTIETGLGDVENVRDNVIKSKALGLRDCFKQELANDNTVMDMLGQLQNIRDKMDPSVFSDATSTIDAFANSKSNLDETKKATVAIKNVDDNTKKSLAHFKNSQKEVAHFGTAVRGLRMVITAGKKRTELSALMGNVDVIRNAADAKKSSLDQQDYNNILKLVPLKNDLTSMFNKIDTFKSYLDAAKPDDINTFGTVFQSATIVPDVVHDAKELKKSLAKLKTLDPTLDTTSLDASLDELAELDLQFSSYNLGQAPTALISLKSFFQDFFGSISKPASQQPQQPASPQSPAAPGSQLRASQASHLAETTKAAGLAGWAIFLIISGVVFVIGLVVFLYCSYKKKQQKEPDDELRPPKYPPWKPDPPQQKNQRRVHSEEDPAVEPPLAEPKPAEPKPADPPLAEAKLAEKATDLAVEKTQSAEKVRIEKSLVVQATQPDMTLSDVFVKPPSPTSADKLSICHSTLELIKNAKKQKRMTALGWAKSFMNGLDLLNPMVGGKKSDEIRGEKMLRLKLNSDIKLLDFGKDHFIHANSMEIGKVKWIMTQGPIDEGEILGRRSTMEKFWAMVDQQDVGAIARLCDFEETITKRQAWIRNSPVKRSSCGVYYPQQTGETLVFGRYTVTTVSINRQSTFFELCSEANKVVVTKVQYINAKDKTPRFVDIVSYTGWPEYSAPVWPDTALTIIDFLVDYKTNVIVHCSDGIGRAPTLVGIKKGIDMSMPEGMKKGQRTTLAALLIALRQVRWKAVDDYKQLFFMLLSIYLGVMNNIGCLVHASDLDLRDELIFYHMRILHEDYQTKNGNARNVNENTVPLNKDEVAAGFVFHNRDQADSDEDQRKDFMKRMKKLSEKMNDPKMMEVIRAENMERAREGREMLYRIMMGKVLTEEDEEVIKKMQGKFNKTKAKKKAPSKVTKKKK